MSRTPTKNPTSAIMANRVVQESEKIYGDDDPTESEYEVHDDEEDEEEEEDTQALVPLSGSSGKKKPTKAEIRGRVRQLVISEIAKEWMPLVVGSMAMIGSSLSNQALPRLMGSLLDQRSSTESTSSSSAPTFSPLSLGLVVVGGGLASFLRTMTLGQAQDRIASRLRKDAFSAIMTKKDLQWFQAKRLYREGETEAAADEKKPKKKPPNKRVSFSDEEDLKAQHQQSTAATATGVSPGAVTSILTEDIDKMSSSFTMSVANLLRSLSSVAFSAHHMLQLDPSLLAVSASVVPLVGAAAMVLRKIIKKWTEQQRSLAAQAASFVEERLLHIQLVKMTNSEEQEVENYNSLQDETLQLGKFTALANGIFMGFLFIASSGSLLWVVHLGGRSVASGRMTSGQLSSFVTYSFLLGLGTSGVIRALSELAQSMISAERYYQLVETSRSGKPAEDAGSDDDTVVSDNRQSSPRNQKVVENGAGPVTDMNPKAMQSITMDNVSFSYEEESDDPSKTRKMALSDVSLTLERGKVVALVGKNGSGKSTIAALLAGLHPPASGRIALDNGTDMHSLSAGTRAQLVQVILQSTALFNMSILENVRYGNPNATEEDVKKALQKANCETFMAKLEGGIHFVVGMNGNKLSGGERQRLALARALLADPMCLIMDEPGSSLDSSGEYAVIEALVTRRKRRNQKPSDTLSAEAQKSQGRGGVSRKELRKQRELQRAILLITHQTKNLLLADEILVLKDGEIVERGTLEQLRTATPRSELCRLMPDVLLTGSSNDEDDDEVMAFA